MLDSSLPVSLQFQLRTQLLEKIQSGEWAVGQLIPSERDLCDEYGVSRITVREVLGSLTQSGYLVRKQGKGTFVAEEKIEYTMTSDYSLGRELKAKGFEDRFILLKYSTEVCSPNYQMIFGLSANEYVVEVIRIRVVNGKNYAWEKSVVPAKYLMNACADDVDKNGLYPTIQKCSNIYPEVAEDLIESVNCPNLIAQALGIEKNAAVTLVTRTTKARGVCVEYCTSYLNGQRYMCKHQIHKRM
ncbi:MAG: GntR family transcriptional regulator [Spirochaetales bacterium]|nr:GntR family transcriptional regulator [Spirochaetales bacterium]